MGYVQLGAFDPTARYLYGLGRLGVVGRPRSRRRLRALGAFDPRSRYLYGFRGMGDDASDYESESVADYFATSQPLTPVEVAPSLATGSGGSTSYVYTGPTSSGPIGTSGNIYGNLPNAGPGYASSAAIPGSSPTGFPSLPLPQQITPPGGSAYTLAPPGTPPTAPGALTVGGQVYVPSASSWFSQSSLIGGMSNMAVLAIGGIAALLLSSGGSGRKR